MLKPANPDEDLAALAEARVRFSRSAGGRDFLEHAERLFDMLKRLREQDVPQLEDAIKGLDKVG